MKISIWNLYYRLSYPNKIPLVKDGSPTIQGVRWIVSKDLNPDMVYIGEEEEFFADIEGNTIIVHRNDMILVQNAEPGEVFNEVSSIMELYQNWDAALEDCYSKPNGLTEMLAASTDIFRNPTFIYAPDGKALAIAPGYPGSIHWHWAEILEHHGLTEARMEALQQSIDLTNVFLDRTPTIRDSHMGDHQYLHCSLVANGYMAGHFVIFSMLRPFENGIEHLVSHFIRHILRYMCRHFEIYSPTSQISRFISALIHDRPYEQKEFLLFQKLLGWNNETDSYQFYILKEKVKGEPVLLSRTLLNCSTILKSSIVFQENNLLLLLLNLDHLSISWNELQALLDSLSKGFYCGISAPFRRIEQVSCYYKQALAELVRCKEQHLQRSCGVEHIGDHLLSMLNQNPLNQTYIVPELRILLEYDRREQTHYYETLRAWFYSGFHPTTAAAMLNIHRNSFNYRMDRLRDLIAFASIDSLTANRNLDVLNEYFYSFMYLDAVDSP